MNDSVCKSSRTLFQAGESESYCSWSLTLVVGCCVAVKLHREEQIKHARLGCGAMLCGMEVVAEAGNGTACSNACGADVSWQRSVQNMVSMLSSMRVLHIMQGGVDLLPLPSDA
jgi:hypothetical protein